MLDEMGALFTAGLFTLLFCCSVAFPRDTSDEEDARGNDVVEYLQKVKGATGEIHHIDVEDPQPTTEGCECSEQGSGCDKQGKCICNTKGAVGDRCDQCDPRNHYSKITTSGLCAYNLTTDYQFTFNMFKELERKNIRRINYYNSPTKPDVDTDFSIVCSKTAKMNITVKTAGNEEKPLLIDGECSNFRTTFPANHYQFGVVKGIPLTTFYVYVYELQPPLFVQVSFSQYPKITLSPNIFFMK